MAGTRRVHRAAPAPPRLHRYSHLLDEMVGCGDMVLLEPLTEEGLLLNLKQRYESGEIYVSRCTTTHRRSLCLPHSLQVSVVVAFAANYPIAVAVHLSLSSYHPLAFADIHQLCSGLSQPLQTH